MDADQPPPPSNPRKVRFTPKAPSRRTPKPTTAPETEVADDAPSDDEAAHSLSRLVNKHLGRQGPKVDKKSSVQVAFAHESASSTSIRTYGTPRESGESNASGLKGSADDDEQILFSLPSTAEPDETMSSSVNAMDPSYQKKKKAYREPWDYQHTEYPISLPWRKPYSGDPELLDEAEFGDSAENLEYDENAINPALDLDLLEEKDKPQLLFLQFPPILPLAKQSASADRKERTESSKPLGSKGASASAKGKDIAGKYTAAGDAGALAAVKGKEMVDSSSMPSERGNASKMCCSLEELPGGYMGKMLIYKSGAIKLKLGNVTYDVSPGTSCMAAQDVVAINTVDKNCCALGELVKRAVVTPDVDSLLDNVIELE